MGNILVERKELENIRKLKRLGFPGKEGTCYLNNNIVYKLYHLYDNKRKVNFCGDKSSCITFPKDILIDSKSNLIAGYTMDYVTGTKLHDGFSNLVSIEILKQAYIKLREELSKYSDIYMDDLCLDNIFFNENLEKFILIDTSRWYVLNDSLPNNVETLDKALVYSLCRNNLAWLINYHDKSPILFDLYRMYKLGERCPFLDLINELSYHVESKFGQKVEKIEDLTPKIFKK